MDAENETRPMAFDNGLSLEQDDRLDDMIMSVSRLIVEIEDLGRHRSYSLAATKLEEAKHWLRDRKQKPA